MTEAEARAGVRVFLAVGELERWIAEQPWEAAPGSWRVRERPHAWRFRLEPVPGGIRIVMSACGGTPAEWTAPA